VRILRKKRTQSLHLPIEALRKRGKEGYRIKNKDRLGNFGRSRTSPGSVVSK